MTEDNAYCRVDQPPRIMKTGAGRAVGTSVPIRGSLSVTVRKTGTADGEYRTPRENARFHQPGALLDRRLRPPARISANLFTDYNGYRVGAFDVLAVRRALLRCRSTHRSCGRG